MVLFQYPIPIKVFPHFCIKLAPCDTTWWILSSHPRIFETNFIGIKPSFTNVAKIRRFRYRRLAGVGRKDCQRESAVASGKTRVARLEAV